MSISVQRYSSVGTGSIITVAGSDVIPFEKLDGTTPFTHASVACCDCGASGWVKLPTPTILPYQQYQVDHGADPANFLVACKTIKVINLSTVNALTIQDLSGSTLVTLGTSSTAARSYCEFYYDDSVPGWFAFCWAGRTA